MAKMMPSGLLYCLLFMLTSADIIPEPKFAAGVRMDGKVDTKLTLSACEKLGGECFHGRKDCPDYLPIETKFGKPYCKSRKERCCYPDPCITPEKCCAGPDECFFLYASNQCFCVFNYTNSKDEPIATFQASKDHCLSKQMVLSHPANAVALRSEIVQRYGDCNELWLNAAFNNAGLIAGPPVGMFWLDNGVKIKAINPLISPESTPTLGPDTCLEMIASEEKMGGSYPNKPYFVAECTESYYHILCQKIK